MSNKQVSYKNLSDVEVVSSVMASDHILVERGGAYRRVPSELVAGSNSGSDIQIDKT